MSRILFDPAKDAANIAKHGISLQRAEDMRVFAILEDDRFDYGELRFRAFGLIDDVPHCLVFTERDGVLRHISLRRAHAKEIQRYAKI
jgi:uncharacterized protein